MSFRPLDFLRAVRVATFVTVTGASVSAQKALLVWLATYADDAGVAWPALTTLAEASGLSVAQIGRCIVVLRAAGWISTSRRTRTSVTRYTLTVPPTAHGAKSQDAKPQGANSQDETCDYSPCVVRPLMVSSATAHGEQRSASLSAQLTAQGSPRARGMGLKTGERETERGREAPKYDLCGESSPARMLMQPPPRPTEDPNAHRLRQLTTEAQAQLADLAKAWGVSPDARSGPLPETDVAVEGEEVAR